MQVLNLNSICLDDAKEGENGEDGPKIELDKVWQVSSFSLPGICQSYLYSGLPAVH